MHYLVKAGDSEGQFESILEASSQSEALGQMGAGEIIENICEISTEDLIKRETENLMFSIESVYLSKWENETVRKYCERQREYRNDPEEQYKALKQFNTMINAAKTIRRRGLTEKFSADEFIQRLWKAAEANTAEEFEEALKI